MSHALLDRALSRDWHHCIDLAPGATTRGSVDLRATAAKVLPQRLDGLRGLDVGTHDGFWAFALEARGASVVATDLGRSDQASGERFGLAHEILGSRVERIVASIDDIDADRLGGPVDFAVAGDLLLKLRDPVGALERVFSALRPGGRLLSLEQVSVPLTLRFPLTSVADLAAGHTRLHWWEPNLRAHRDWLRTAGFAPRLKRIDRREAAGARTTWHSAWIATKR